MALASTLVEFFVIGLLTPLTAACALPLYPGFIVYLSSQGASADDGDTPDGAAVDGGVATADHRTGTGDGGESDGTSPFLLGTMVVAGVIAFMFLLGLVFSTLLEVSLTVVIEVISPIAFAILAVVSVALIFDLDFFYRIPTVEPPQTSHPVGTAFGYGFFFGAIVVPCNPALIAFFLARSFLVTDPVAKLLGFLAFGLGIGAPLLVLALVSEGAGRRVTRTLARHRTAINRVSGLIMLGVSLYYLLVVFDTLGIAGSIPL